MSMPNGYHVMIYRAKSEPKEAEMVHSLNSAFGENSI